MADAPKKGSNRALILVLALCAASFGCCGCCAGLGWYLQHRYEILVVAGDGMFPNIAGGTRFIVTRSPYANAEDVRRGDVVVISRIENGEKKVYVWRVVGLPGDRVQTSLLSVSVNGQKLPLVRSRVIGKTSISFETNGAAQYEVAYEDNPEELPGFRPGEAKEIDLVVPAGEFFLMGDNRHRAADSRTMGTIPFSSITGKKW